MHQMINLTILKQHSGKLLGQNPKKYDALDDQLNHLKKHSGKTMIKTT